MKKDDRVYFQDILDAIDLIEEFSKNLTLERFEMRGAERI